MKVFRGCEGVLAMKIVIPLITTVEIKLKKYIGVPHACIYVLEFYPNSSVKDVRKQEIARYQKKLHQIMCEEKSRNFFFLLTWLIWNSTLEITLNWGQILGYIIAWKGKSKPPLLHTKATLCLSENIKYISHI